MTGEERRGQERVARGNQSNAWREYVQTSGCVLRIRSVPGLTDTDNSRYEAHKVGTETGMLIATVRFY